MRFFIAVTLVFLAVAGCARKDERPANMAAPAMAAPAAQEPAEAQHSQLAYEHSIRFEVEDDRVAPLSEAVRAACDAASIDACETLESRLTGGDNASASLKFRATPSGSAKLSAVLDAGGKLVDKSVTAEDLAKPIEDTSKKLALLTQYRNRLETLFARAGGDIDALIKINRELAQVQSDIETLAGDKAHLVQRVETEILYVAIASTRTDAFWHPIAQAFSGFGNSLSHATAAAITAVAYLIPWGLVLVFGVWLGRKLWRRARKANAAS